MVCPSIFYRRNWLMPGSFPFPVEEFVPYTQHVNLRLVGQPDRGRPFEGYPDPVLGAVTPFSVNFGKNCPRFQTNLQKNDF